MSSVNEKLLIGISRVRNHLHRELDVVFRENGLTSPQFAVLEVLYSKGELCVGEIQEAILSTPGNVPVIIHNLEKQGLISRRTSDIDKRVSLIALTDKGHRLITKVYPAQTRRLDELLAGYAPETKQQLVSLLRQFS